MKILELGKFYPPVRGGIETLLKSLCEGFQKSGAEVECVVANDRNESVCEIINGVRVRRMASLGTLFSTSISPGYLRAARESEARIWHAHFPNPLADLAVLRAPASARVVISYHSDIVRQAAAMAFYRPLLQGCLKRADKIVVATPRHIEFSTSLAPHRDKCVVIPFGIDAGRFAAPRALPPNIPVPARRPILLTVGRLVGYKGHRWLIDAMKKIEGTLWIVGTGPLEDQLRRQVSESVLNERVQFLGNVADADLPALYQACDIFVLPSITPNEAFGIVQLEAMACGKPVVSCDLKSGVPWVNQHNVTGFVVPPRDSERLGKAIQQLANDPALAKQLGEAGRQRVAAELTEEKMVARYMNLFQELAA
jgi:glycosyltransferase involved in cell wall biosynthesis